MTVGGAGLSMSGPAGVSDPDVSVKFLLKVQVSGLCQREHHISVLYIVFLNYSVIMKTLQKQ